MASLPADAIDLMARCSRAVGHPLRLRVLEYLTDCGEASVQQLSDALGVTRPTVSKHLALLWEVGLIERRRTGRSTVYAPGGPSAHAVFHAISEHAAAYGGRLSDAAALVTPIAEPGGFTSTRLYRHTI